MVSQRSSTPTAPLALIAARIVEESSKSEVELANLSALAQSDPAFAVRLLATVNSAAFGLRRRVADVQQAVVLLGTRGLRNLGLSLALSDMVPAGQSTSALLAVCLRRAAAARCVARASRLFDPEEAFTLGLFLEVGLLTLARDDLPAAVSLASRPALDRTVLERADGLTPHPEVGAAIGEQFHLPPEMIDAIRRHHEPGAPAGAAARIAWCAERVAAAFEPGGALPGRNHALGSLLELGIGHADAKELLATLPGEVQSCASVLDRDVGPQPDLEALASDAQRALVELNLEYESVLRRLEDVIQEKERVAASLREANQQLEELAATDLLTRLPNNRAFFDGITRELARAQRARTPVALLVLDIDHFKRVNDTHGHPAGDEVLRGVADIVRSTLRAGDMPARYGGEEFVVMLPGTDLRGAKIVAERVRQAIERTPLRIDRDTQLSITTSIGAACAPVGDATPKQLFARADAALYAAKRGGRNVVVLESADRSAPLVA